MRRGDTRREASVQIANEEKDVRASINGGAE